MENEKLLPETVNLDGSQVGTDDDSSIVSTGSEQGSQKKKGLISRFSENVQSVAHSFANTTRKALQIQTKEEITKLEEIKQNFIRTLGDVVIDEDYGTMPTINLPVIAIGHLGSAAKNVKDLNVRFTNIQITQNVAGQTSATAAATSTAAKVALATLVDPTLISVPLLICICTFILFQRAKNKELLYASELIFSICQEMLYDLVKMVLFYSKTNDVKTNKPIVNPFIQKTLNKITDLQVLIISVCELEVVEYLALSFGIIENFGENFNENNNYKIFGSIGMNNGCHLSEDKRVSVDGKKMEDVECDGSPSVRSYASIKRAIIERLQNKKMSSSSFLRKFRNFTASGELYRQLIRDITIVGIFFSQASARFSLDAIGHVLELKDATIQVSSEAFSAQIETVKNAAGTGETLMEDFNTLSTQSDNSEIDNTGGRRRKRTRKYRR